MSCIIPISDCRTLIVKIFVIGYRERGESIVILFFDKTNVVYSIVIDSYKAKKSEFFTSKILDDNKVSKLNILCWTHPDIDHSVGIEELFEQYCDNESSVYVPIYMNGMNTDPIEYNKDDIETINKFFTINDRTHKCIKPVSANIGGKSHMTEIVFSDELHEIKTKIEVYAPHADCLVEKIRTNSKIKKNQLSIFLMLQVGPYVFDFSGDVENMAITNMNEEPFNNPLFLKIPHHSSKTSDKLLGRLKNSSQSMSCTTTYYSQRLPQIEILNEYQKRYSHLHSTGLSKEDKYSYGVLEYVFDLFGARNVHIKRHGNACKITNDLTS